MDFCSSQSETATAWRNADTTRLRLRALRISSLPSRTVFPETPAPTRRRTVGNTTVSPALRVRSSRTWIIAPMVVPM